MTQTEGNVETWPIVVAASPQCGRCLSRMELNRVGDALDWTAYCPQCRVRVRFVIPITQAEVLYGD